MNASFAEHTRKAVMEPLGIAEHSSWDLAGLAPQADGSWLVDGNVTIRDLNRTLGWHLPDEDASTVAGLVLFESRTIPNPGQEFRFHDIRFRIVKRKGNRLIQLRLWAK